MLEDDLYIGSSMYACDAKYIPQIDVGDKC